MPIGIKNSSFSKYRVFLVTDEQMDKNEHVENIMPPSATQA